MERNKRHIGFHHINPVGSRIWLKNHTIKNNDPYNKVDPYNKIDPYNKVDPYITR